MKKYGGTVEIKSGVLDICLNRRPQLAIFCRTTNKRFGTTGVACYSTSFDRLSIKADTVQCSVQTNQKMQNITLFAAVVEWPTVGVFRLE